MTLKNLQLDQVRIDGGTQQRASINEAAVAEYAEAIAAAREEGRQEGERSAEHCRYWYAVRLRRLRDLAEKHGILTPFCSIVANGTEEPHEPLLSE